LLVRTEPEEGVKVDGIPAPYDRFMVLDDGEQPVDCWYGMSVVLDPWGRVFSTERNYMGRPVAINTKGALVVLTNRRLQHYHRSGDLDAYGVGSQAYLYLAVPFATIQGASVVGQIGSRLLQVQVQGEVQYGSPQGGPAERPENGALLFDMAFGVDLQAVAVQVQSLARQGGPAAPPLEFRGTDSAPANPPSEAGSSEGSDSFIHLHAEDDADDT
jgi:hypothetical protein